MIEVGGGGGGGVCHLTGVAVRVVWLVDLIGSARTNSSGADLVFKMN